MLSIIIPAYNEEKRIGRTLENYANFFNSAYKEDYEILVVLNGCEDGTLDVVRMYCKKYHQIKFIEYKERIGKGGAIIEGFKHAKGKLIGFVDADMATKPHSFNNLILEMEDNDGVIASRYLPGSVIITRQPLIRKVI